MPVEIPHKYHDSINRDGFVIIRQFLTPAEIEHYYRVSSKLIQYARDGNWSLVRTRGKQFPPWPIDHTPDIWGVSSLLHPDLPDELTKPYHDFYASDKILNVVADILQCNNDAELQISMELLNMLINPLTDFELDWHRDTIKPEVNVEEEASALLQNPFAGTQFNLSLTNDNCLIVVPGSHNRVRTETERNITIDPETRKQFIPGQITVELKPGDIVFYNSNILHRAVYKSSAERITLHGSYGHVDYGDERAKGVLQHGVAKWLNNLQSDNEKLCQLRDNLKQMAERFKDKEIVYALDG